MFSALFKWLFGTTHFTGVKPDTRLQSEKNRDYLHDERQPIESATAPFSNAKLAESPYPYTNQFNTSSCVPNAIALALSIERKMDNNVFFQLSPIFAYRLRNIYPTEGSVPQNIFDIMRKYGAPLFASLPTPETEQAANNISITSQNYSEASIYKGLTYWTLKEKFNDIDELARIAQLGHAVPITLFATEEEYSRQYPVILKPSLTYAQAAVRHEVCILPYSSFVENGIKYVAIQDSAFFGGWKLRYLSEEFIKARLYGSGYWDTVQIVPNAPKPVFTFTHTLKFGDRNDEVKKMQELLISEGLLPVGLNTGLFAGRSLAAVKAFQTKYTSEILAPNGLMWPTGFWGPASIKKANQLVNSQ